MSKKAACFQAVTWLGLLALSLASCTPSYMRKSADREVKRILIDTAMRLPHVAVERQGWGIVNPRLAVETALSRSAAADPPASAKAKVSS